MKFPIPVSVFSVEGSLSLTGPTILRLAPGWFVNIVLQREARHNSLELVFMVINAFGVALEHIVGVGNTARRVRLLHWWVGISLVGEEDDQSVSLGFYSGANDTINPALPELYTVFLLDDNRLKIHRGIQSTTEAPPAMAPEKCIDVDAPLLLDSYGEVPEGTVSPLGCVCITWKLGEPKSYNDDWVFNPALDHKSPTFLRYFERALLSGMMVTPNMLDLLMGLPVYPRMVVAGVLGWHAAEVRRACAYEAVVLSQALSGS